MRADGVRRKSCLNGMACGFSRYGLRMVRDQRDAERGGVCTEFLHSEHFCGPRSFKGLSCKNYWYEIVG
jgi:hypothetical protein